MRTASRFLLPLALGLAFLTSTLAPQLAAARGMTQNLYTAANRKDAARKAAVRTGAFNMNSRKVIAAIGTISARRVTVTPVATSPSGQITTFEVATRLKGADGKPAATDTVKVRNMAQKKDGKFAARGYTKEGDRTVKLNPTARQAAPRPVTPE